MIKWRTGSKQTVAITVHSENYSFVMRGTMFAGDEVPKLGVKAPSSSEITHFLSNSGEIDLKKITTLSCFVKSL